MASFRARTAAFLVKTRLKGRLHRASDVATIRELMTPPASRLPREVRVIEGEAGGVPGEWVEGAQAQATMVYLHGGGYVACSPRTHRPVTAAFARLGFRVFAPDYRLAPEHVFPAAVEDACAVFRALRIRGMEPLVVAGDSAGGGLAVALMIALRDAGEQLPAGAALFSPWTDLAASGDSLSVNNSRCAMFYGEDIGPIARIYLGAADPRHPLASPLYADLAHLPPLLIHVGAKEVLLDDSRRLAARAQAAGVSVDFRIWAEVPHVWQLAPTLMPEARQSLQQAAEFLLRAAEDRQPTPIEAPPRDPR
jgi:acetyl esterase/lipase